MTLFRHRFMSPTMPFDYSAVLSGKKRDPASQILRVLLWLISLVYQLVMRRRNQNYDSGRSPIHDAGIPVISVGNLTTGGTGKTPIVCYLAGHLRERGVRVAIISRGYGRGEADANDEALELYDRLPDVPHLQDPDRVASAKIAVEELGAELLLMDDGFQHRRLKRDLDLVAIDATRPFGFGFCLPRGLLREPVAALSRADVVLLTRCDQVDRGQVEAIRQQINRYAGDALLVETKHVALGLFEYPGEFLELRELDGARIAAVSAIGNPQAFEETLCEAGAQVIASRRLPDHDAFSPETVEMLREWVNGLGDSIDQVICTHKDLVKLQTDRLGGRPVRALQIELVVEQGEGVLLGTLKTLLDPTAADSIGKDPV